MSDYGACPGEHGGVRLETEVSIKSVILADLINPTSNGTEYEVMFKGGGNVAAEVIEKK